MMLFRTRGGKILLDAAPAGAPQSLSRSVRQSCSAGAFLFLLGGCLPLSMVPVELDRQLGEQTARQVSEQIGVYEAPATGQYVRAIGERLVAQLDERQFPFVFNVVDQKEPNAFAAPGGYVYVSRGLLALANSEAELAGVMGHEIIHITERHSVRQSRKGILPRVLSLPGAIVGSVLSTEVGALLNAPVGLAGNVFLASYGRGQESEADKLGMRLAAASGYDPRELGVILSHLEQAQEAQSGEAAHFSFFDSHPMTPKRVKEIDRGAAELQWSPQPPVASTQREFLQRLDGIALEEDPAQGVFRKRQFLQPAANFTITFPDGWKTQNTPSAVAAVAEKEEALAVIGLAGKDADPDKVAEMHMSDMKRQHNVEPTEARAVKFGDWHGRLVTYADTTGKEPMTLYFLWVRMGAMTYQLIGLGPEKYRERLKETALSLRPMTDEERTSMTVKRLRIVEARAGETLAGLGQRAGNGWSPAFTAIANGLSEAAALEAGQLIKISREEPYRSE